MFARARFQPEDNVREGRMFNGQGLSVDGRFFAFVNHCGHLVVKLSADDVRTLIGNGRANPLIMGKRTLREWVTVSPPASRNAETWAALLAQAHAFIGCDTERAKKH